MTTLIRAAGAETRGDHDSAQYLREVAKMEIEYTTEEDTWSVWLSLSHDCPRPYTPVARKMSHAAAAQEALEYDDGAWVIPERQIIVEDNEYRVATEPGGEFVKWTNRARRMADA